jgi:hypothetical protein
MPGPDGDKEYSAVRITALARVGVGLAARRIRGSHRKASKGELE